MAARLAGRDDMATARDGRHAPRDRQRRGGVRLVGEAPGAVTARTDKREPKARRDERQALGADGGDRPPLVGDDRVRVVELVAQRLRADRPQLTRRGAVGSRRRAVAAARGDRQPSGVTERPLRATRRRERRRRIRFPAAAAGDHARQHNDHHRADRGATPVNRRFCEARRRHAVSMLRRCGPGVLRRHRDRRPNRRASAIRRRRAAA
jgi:hypothetical protein